jgi:hypothetical protein
MLEINLKHDLKEIMDEVGAFSEREQRQATMRALNRAAQGAITDGSQKIRERYKKLKKRDVDDAFSIQPATMDTLRATVIIRGRPLSLARFLAGQVTARGRGGVWVNVKGDRKFIPHVWTQAMKTKGGDDYLVIMGRVGKARFPVEVLKTIDIPGAFEVADVISYVEEQSGVRFETELIRNLTFLESKR